MKQIHLLLLLGIVLFLCYCNRHKIEAFVGTVEAFVGTIEAFGNQLIVPQFEFAILTPNQDPMSGYFQEEICRDDSTWKNGDKKCVDYSMDRDSCLDKGDDGKSAKDACPVSCDSCPSSVKIKKREPSPVEDTQEPDYAVFDEVMNLDDGAGGVGYRELYEKIDDINEQMDTINTQISASNDLFNELYGGMQDRNDLDNLPMCYLSSIGGETERIDAWGEAKEGEQFGEQQCFPQARSLGESAITSGARVSTTNCRESCKCPQGWNVTKNKYWGIEERIKDMEREREDGLEYSEFDCNNLPFIDCWWKTSPIHRDQSLHNPAPDKPAFHQFSDQYEQQKLNEIEYLWASGTIITDGTRGWHRPDGTASDKEMRSRNIVQELQAEMNRDVLLTRKSEIFCKKCSAHTREECGVDNVNCEWDPDPEPAAGQRRPEPYCHPVMTCANTNLGEGRGEKEPTKYTCGENKVLKNDPDTIRCPGDSCSEDLCCSEEGEDGGQPAAGGERAAQATGVRAEEDEDTSG